LTNLVRASACLSFLRERGYLVVEETDGISAHQLNPVSDRHDRLALLELFDEWRLSEGEAP